MITNITVDQNYLTCSYTINQVPGGGVVMLSSNGNTKVTNPNGFISDHINGVSVGINSRLESVIFWVEQKMLEDEKEKELLKKHPHLAEIKEQYILMKSLVESNT